MKILEFKTVSPLYEMERDGIKPFTVRKYDSKDKRFRTMSRAMVLGEKVGIKITNPATGESFIRSFEGMGDVPFITQRWIIIYLGERAEL